MVKNREELLRVAESNVRQLKDNLSKSVQAFMVAHNTNPEELAYALGISNEEMENIIAGDGVITLDTLSKLLIATDMAVVIKPVSMTPLHAYGDGMPKSGPLPPRFGMMPPAGFAPRAHDIRGEQGKKPLTQPRDSHGRFAPRQRPQAPKPNPFARRSSAAPSANREDNPYNTMTIDALVNIIRQNLWDGEIDIENSSRQQIIDFVMAKERLLRERTSGVGAHVRPTAKEMPDNVEPRATEVHGGGKSFNKFLEMINNVAKEAKDNPELMDIIERFMPNMD